MSIPNASLLACLQLIRLKGRVTPEVLATSLDLSADEATANIAQLQRQALVAPAGTAWRITPDGRTALADWVSQERSGVDQHALGKDYHAFDPVNSHFKQIVSDWQLRDGAPNDHADAAYDNAIIARLVELDAGFSPLLSHMVAIAPRLAHYPARLDRALQRLREGDASWLARPISDSYHTVWFELHEDLIGLLGLSRVEEAAAGRAE